MSPDQNLQRTWQEIAEETCRETNPEKLQKLAEELNRVLAKHCQSAPAEKPAKKAG